MESENQASSHTSVSNAEPTKLPSIRVVSDGPTANREDDLEGGPLLRDLGSSLQNIDDADYQLHLDPILSASSSGHTTGDLHPSESLHTRGTLETSYAETLGPSESSNGESFSVPTDSASNVSPRHGHSLDTGLLIGIRPSLASILETDRNIPLDIGPPVGVNTEADPNHDLILPLPWRFEFSYEMGSLAFAGEHFEAKRIHSSPSNDTTSSCASVTGSNGTVIKVPVDIKDFAASAMNFDNLEVERILSDISERFSMNLDERYWRTHGAQRSGKSGSKARQCGGENQQSTPYSRGNLQSSSRSRPRHSRRGLGGNGDDEQDDSENDDGLLRTRTTSRQESPLRVDCPFYKRRPNEFRACCGIGYVKISHLKDHLKKHHAPLYYCKICFLKFFSDVEHQHLCQKRLKPVDDEFITNDVLAVLTKRASRGPSIGDQWLEVFKILFPDDEPPYPSPYVQSRVKTYTKDIEIFLLKNSDEMFEEEEKRCSLKQLAVLRSTRGARNKLFADWISRALHRYCSEDAVEDKKQHPRANDSVSLEPMEQADDPSFLDPHHPLELEASSLPSQNAPDIIDHVFETNMFGESWTPAPDEATMYGTNDTFPVTDPFVGYTSNMDKPSLTYPASELPPHQQMNFNSYDEAWYPGARLNAENYASTSFYDEHPETNNIQPDFMSLPNDPLNWDELLSTILAGETSGEELTTVPDNIFQDNLTSHYTEVESTYL